MSQPIDIEVVLQEVVGRTGNLPWRGCSERELAFDHGYTAIPNRCSREYRAGGTLLRRSVDGDVATVLAALDRIDPAVVAVILAHARDKTRPNCFPGVEPKRVPRSVYGRRRNGKRRGRPVIVMVWNIEPTTIRAAREVYARWHGALSLLADCLRGTLDDWEISGFAAPAAPWLERIEETA